MDEGPTPTLGVGDEPWVPVDDYDCSDPLKTLFLLVYSLAGTIGLMMRGPFHVSPPTGPAGHLLYAAAAAALWAWLYGGMAPDCRRKGANANSSLFPASPKVDVM
jgi:hypothetical protein